MLSGKLSFSEYGFLWSVCSSCGFMNFYFISKCGRDIPQWSQWPAIWCDSLPLGASGTCDLLLSDRIWQRWWDVALVILLCYTRLDWSTIFLIVLSKPMALLWAAPGHIVSCPWQGPHGKTLWWPLGPEGSLQAQPVRSSPLATHPQGNKFFQLPKWVCKWILPWNASRQVWEALISGPMLRLLTHRSCVIIDVCGFKPLNLR